MNETTRIGMAAGVTTSAAPIARIEDLPTLPDGAFFFHEEGWTVQRDIKGRGWKVSRNDGEAGA